EDADHGAGGALNLKVSAVGTASLPEQMKKQVKELLDAHPTWKRRSLHGVESTVVKADEPSAAELRDSVNLAMELLRQGKLVEGRRVIDVALAHSPEDSALWFLSAALNGMVGAEDLIVRDLYRLTLLEDRDSLRGDVRRRERERKLERMQGD